MPTKKEIDPQWDHNKITKIDTKNKTNSDSQEWILWPVDQIIISCLKLHFATK